MKEYFCKFVGRDMSTCDAYLRVDLNDYQAPVKARSLGWATGYGDSRCPEHKPADGDKVKAKNK